MLSLRAEALIPPGRRSSDYYGKHADAVNDAFNHGVRTSGAYDVYVDAYVDFGEALADPRVPERIVPAYDSGDHLRPNDAGHRAMARAVAPGAL